VHRFLGSLRSQSCLAELHLVSSNDNEKAGPPLADSASLSLSLFLGCCRVSNPTEPLTEPSRSPHGTLTDL
jgi:hypothetical protein